MRVAAPPTRLVPPDWREDLHTLYRGRIARQFVLHFNLNDLVLDLDQHRELDDGRYERWGNVVPDGSGQLLTLREYLRTFLFGVLGCAALYTYSLAGGLGAEETPGGADGSDRSGAAWERLREAARALRLPPEPELPEGQHDSLRLLGHLLRRGQADVRRGQPGGRPGQPPIAVLVDYVEKLVPFDLEEGRGGLEQLQAMEMLQRWAVDPAIRRSNNVIVLLTDNLGQVPRSLYAEGSGCRAIRVPLPTEREREAFVRFKRASPNGPFAGLHSGDFPGSPAEQARRLARATQGMRLTDIDNISRRVIVEHRKQGGQAGIDPSSALLRLAHVQKAKSEAIEAQSAGLLEIVPPVRGFAEIGGLETIKAYLKKRTGHMLSQEHLHLVPSGLLLAGPPGTGKTIIAEALATESGFNLVKMRSIQDRWVGSSERNLEMVLDLLDDLHPVVVFVDEVDQAMGRRDTGQNLDSGVGARMFGRVLEAMSDPAARGKILWVAATNRADLLDDALLRRFDRVLPLLTPDVVESCHVFATMLRTIARQSGAEVVLAYGADLEGRDPARAGTPDDPFFDMAERTAGLGLTGASIEIVVRRAVELAYEEAAEGDGAAPPRIWARHLHDALDDFKANHNRVTYDHQSLLAIRACNFRSVIPRLPAREPYTGVISPSGEIEPQKLELAIERLARGGTS